MVCPTYNRGMFRRSLSGVLFGIMALACAGACIAADPESIPLPPCGGDVFPEYPEVDQAPAVSLGARRAGRPMDTTRLHRLEGPGFATLVVAAGRFSSAGSGRATAAHRRNLGLQGVR